MMVAATLIFAAAAPPPPQSGARVEVRVSATIVRGFAPADLLRPQPKAAPAEPLRTAERPCDTDPQTPQRCRLIVTDLP